MNTYVGRDGCTVAETHVFSGHDEGTRVHTLECGLSFVEPLDKFASFPHPYYGWWDLELATCAECKQATRDKYSIVELQAAWEFFRQEALK